MHFYERRKQKFVYIYLFVLARRFYRFLKNFPNVEYDILERGYRYVIIKNIDKDNLLVNFENCQLSKSKSVKIYRLLVKFDRFK